MKYIYEYFTDFHEGRWWISNGDSRSILILYETHDHMEELLGKVLLLLLALEQIHFTLGQQMGLLLETWDLDFGLKMFHIGIKGSLTYYVVHFWVFSTPSPPQCKHDSIWKTPSPQKIVLRSMWTVPTLFYLFSFQPFLEISQLFFNYLERF